MILTTSLMLVRVPCAQQHLSAADTMPMLTTQTAERTVLQQRMQDDHEDVHRRLACVLPMCCRHTSRFLVMWSIFLPFGLWQVSDLSNVEGAAHAVPRRTA